MTTVEKALLLIVALVVVMLVVICAARADNPFTSAAQRAAAETDAAMPQAHPDTLLKRFYEIMGGTDTMSIKINSVAIRGGKFNGSDAQQWTITLDGELVGSIEREPNGELYSDLLPGNEFNGAFHLRVGRFMVRAEEGE